MVNQQKLIDKVSTYLSPLQVNTIKHACELAIISHGSQLRDSNEPYYQHPIEVAYIMANMKMDTATIITALLHDTVEDTELTLEDIERDFGNEISKLVDGITKLTKIECQSEHTRQAENFRKLLLAMSDDIRVLLVKLADRVHNMRTIKFIKSHERRLRISHETMEIYAPLAERIGIQTFKSELQDLAFAELYPEARNSIINRLNFLRQEGKILIDKIIEQISEMLTKEDIKVSVSGREKTACSIWQKMERKNISFEQLSDIVAFRIMAETKVECYQILGIIHSHYHMVPDCFKDFISTPKANGYQSIHTVVVGPDKQRIEIQIRTHYMHKIAELGVAAHWTYKQNYQHNVDGKQYRWIRELLEILEHTSDPEEFLEHTKLEMYYDQVFAFTPKGNIIALPKGATPVDFAYAIHSDVGNTCVGAKVNGRIVPLRTLLNNGDQVEIIRAKTQVPSPSWEKFVITGKARSEIRRFIKAKQRQEYINLGRIIITKMLRGYGKEFNEKTIEPAVEFFKKRTLEDLLTSVGEGVINRYDVIKAIFPNNKKQNSLKSKFSFLRFGKKKIAKSQDSIVPIKGLMPGMAIHFAGCCHPLPGDNIIGIVHTGKGITIHVIDCEMLENFTSNPERWLEIAWDKDSANMLHVGRIKVILAHEQGGLATMSNTIAKENANIVNLKIVNRTSDFFEIVLDVEVLGVKHLLSLISALRTKHCVHSAERYKA
ncbi:MAG: bifunctional (p)ppGpp synthetase/guanosine-3',5'-bis(diphosphate) 3'-pyrophosphohydrolase [Rickettsiales endosymbiont of Dermacentor nuttalli]